jgi:uncharacterized iron-regulated membrane protein
MIFSPKSQRYIRKSHRYLGFFLGIQFLFWTVGGIYFSWTKIEKIRGEDIRVAKESIKPTGLAPISNIVDSLNKLIPNIQFESLQLTTILHKNYYQIHLTSPSSKHLLFDAQTLQLKKPIQADEAKQIAQLALKIQAPIERVEYLTTTGGHHEYREKPLPAYAISFGKPAQTTVYISTELGTVQSFRNDSWRIFDFLWMLHTMDYQDRDNINNWALRIFSIIGLVTLISGFLLFFITSRFK